MLTNAMAMVTKWMMALAMTLQVTKWVMVRATRAIVINAVAAVALVLASTVAAAIFIIAAATTIAQRRRPQCSHCSGCHHLPPLRHINQTSMAWAMAMEAMAKVTRLVGERWQQWQWRQRQNARW
jgi:hypothetical protein